MKNAQRYGLLPALVLIAGVSTALFAAPFWIQVGISVALTAILALAFDITARCGQVTLATAGFFGLGAYSVAILQPHIRMVPAYAAAAIICAAAAAFVGAVTLRLRGMYFSIATLGFGLSLQVVALVFASWTGGASGVAPPRLAAGDPQQQLMVITAFVAVATIISGAFLSPRLRPAMFMIRETPRLAAASGVPVVATKIGAFCVSGVLAGMAGACFSGLYGYMVPTDVLTLNWSIIPLAIAIFGGVDSSIGPLVGAVALRMVEEQSRDLISDNGYQVVYGAVIVLSILVMPGGLVGAVRAAGRRLRPGRRIDDGNGVGARSELGDVRGLESA